MKKAFPESADALDDDFELDTGLVASDDEDGESRAADSSAKTRRGAGAGAQAIAGPSSGRRAAAPAASARLDIGEEEDEFALEEDDDQDNDDDEEEAEEGRRTRDDSMDQDEYGLPVGRRPAAPSRKRDADELSDGGEPAAGESNAPLSKEEKKRRRKEKTKEAKRRSTQSYDEAEAEVDTSFIAYQPPQLQADFMAEMQALALPSLSAIEAEDFRVAESHLMDTTAIETRKNLKDFITSATKLKKEDLKLAKSSKAGSPRLLIVSGAALRSADVVREVKDLAEKCEVAKLFAKHIKLGEHIAYCQKTRFSIGAGTPDRIQKLLEADALLLDTATHLIIDTKKDSKKRNILDIPESRVALFKLLGSAKLNARLKQGSLKLVLY